MKFTGTLCVHWRRAPEAPWRLTTERPSQLLRPLAPRGRSPPTARRPCPLPARLLLPAALRCQTH